MRIYYTFLKSVEAGHELKKRQVIIIYGNFLYKYYGTGA
jgi:hypothetical protein